MAAKKEMTQEQKNRKKVGLLAARIASARSDIAGWQREIDAVTNPHPVIEAPK